MFGGLRLVGFRGWDQGFWGCGFEGVGGIRAYGFSVLCSG